MLKTGIKLLLQNVLGFDNYLFIFSVITGKMVHMNKHEQEFLHFLDLLPTDHILLDLGANIGIMTVPLSKKATNGKVYAFEPMPQNLNTLKRIIRFYNLRNVTVFETALGSQAGELKMVMPIVNNVKMQGLCHVVDDNNPERGKHFTVPVKRLDDIPELQTAKAIGGIKIDVENFELEVFKGARKLLLKYRPIIYCEIWDNKKRAQTINYIKNEMGYYVKVYDGQKLVHFTNQEAVNFFLIP